MIIKNSNFIVVLLRNPMPDQYTVTMETARDRTTRAFVVLCTAEMKQGRLCPEDVGVGDTFVNRSLNEPCPNMVSYSFTYNLL